MDLLSFRPIVPPLVSFALLIGLGGCATTSDPGADPRLRTAHRTYATLGMVLDGEISEGEVAAAGEVRVERELSSFRCYHVLLLGYAGLRQASLLIRDPQGQDLAQGSTREGEAAMRICTERSGSYELVVRAGPAGGRFALTVWASPSSSCGTPLSLHPDDAIQGEHGERRWTLEGSTTEADSNLTASCVQGSAPEQIYQLHLDSSALLRAEIETTYDGALYLTTSCQDASSVLACNDDAGDIRHSRISKFVPPGDYFFVVDGYGDERGDFQLRVEAVPSEALAASCAQAPVLRPDGPREFSLGSHDRFDGSCGRGGPEQIFRIEIAERSLVHARFSGEGAATLHLRSECAGEGGEIACGRQSVQATLEPGTHFLVVEGGAGRLSLDARPAPLASAACGEGIAVETLPLQGMIRGSTGRSSHFTTEAGSGCGGGALGNDTVYHLHLEQASTVRLLLLSEFDGVLHLRRECGDPSSELACNDDFSAARSMATQHSFLFIERLEPGDYFVIVDAYVETGGGAFALQIMTGALGDLP